MKEHKIVKYTKNVIEYDEEQIDKRGKKTIKHLNRLESDEEFFERIESDLNGFSVEGWTVAIMNNVMPSFNHYSEGPIFYSDYFSFLLTREKVSSQSDSLHF